MKKTMRIIPALLAVLLLAGCGTPATPAATTAPTVAEETAAVTSATPKQETEPAAAAKVLAKEHKQLAARDPVYAARQFITDMERDKLYADTDARMK